MMTNDEEFEQITVINFQRLIFFSVPLARALFKLYLWVDFHGHEQPESCMWIQ